MDTRSELIDRVRVLLARTGFAVSERCEVRPISFDVVARRDNRLLILKILGNVDALSERVAQELRTLARFLDGRPMLLGERASAGPLEDGVVYVHRGIPCITVATLEELLLENAPPLVEASPGGLNVRLDGARLRRIREARALSLGALAEVAGVSRRAIQMYEEGMRATIEAALRLEEFLGESIVSPLDPFESFEAGADVPRTPPRGTVSPFEAEVFGMLRGVGFQVVPTSQSPFEAVTHRQEVRRESILTGVQNESDAQARRRAQLISSIAAVTEKDGMVVVRREVRVSNLQGTPIVLRDELERLRDPEELRTLLKERKVRSGDSERASL
jgi:putative transcriptional regulator